ncbi:MAG: hypothetical protein RL518_86 [Pseudomonadota bacterium]
MELPRLAAKQKRYRDVLRYATSEDIDPATKSQILSTLNRYQAALAACWRSQGGSPQEEQRVTSLEREIDTLFGSARLRTMTP